VKCAGLHIDEGIVENAWLAPGVRENAPVQPGSRSIHKGAVSIRQRVANSSDLREVWFAVESNSETIFQSTSLLAEFESFLKIIRDYSPDGSGVPMAVPSFTMRLKPSSGAMTISTFFACDPEEPA
jgi:hypothetical protein